MSLFEQQQARRKALVERLLKVADLACETPLAGDLGDVAYDLLRQAAAQIASDQQHFARLTPSGGEGETVPSIPAGMVPWEGGPSAPDDWDGGPVLFGNGNLLQPSSAIPNRWSHPQGAPGWWIIAYTPKPSTTGQTVPGDEWVMVPREPTEAMLGAASGPSVAVYANEEENQWTALNADEAREVWSAMLTASPKQAPVTVGAASGEVALGKIKAAIELAFGDWEGSPRGDAFAYVLSVIHRETAALSAYSPLDGQEKGEGQV